MIRAMRRGERTLTAEEMAFAEVALRRDRIERMDADQPEARPATYRADAGRCQRHPDAFHPWIETEQRFLCGPCDREQDRS